MLGMGPDGQESEIPKCTASLARPIWLSSPTYLRSDRFSGTIIIKDSPAAVSHWLAHSQE